MKIGILTGGGDCPGLNAVIRAVVRKGITAYGDEVFGILEGWKGLLKGQTERLDLNKVSGILHRGGTIIKTSRTNPYKEENGEKVIIQQLQKLGLDAIIAVGGEDTLGVASRLHQAGVKVVGVPKTIDNDVSGTDYSFGFDTAVNIAMEAIDRLHSTAESHNRVIVVEVMGRHAGWIAVHSGIAAGADVILIPEKPVDLDQVCQVIKKRHDRGRDFSLVVVAEGAKITSEQDKDGRIVVQRRELDQFGHVRLGGIGQVLAEEIEKRTGYEARYVILGYIQRGGSPTAFDRVLGTRFGIAAIDLVHRGEFGKVVCLRGNSILSMPIADAIGKPKLVDQELFNVAQAFFG
ncbi:MAG: pyrophosphate--fructose-6-phosphate 1-phosphotransferase [candidate division Zixibacteria bacterium RBG_16_50_21]|nr:MAG: pyrophosphate--fructose-6-phosphate 1-phosphotransferase [candidate division Zixibacteria bacterium RBG_16_50_21]